MKVLVVAAHPDDEALGCGGTIAKHADVTVLTLTDGVGSRDGKSSVAGRVYAHDQAARFLGFKSIRADLPDNQLDAAPLLKVVRLVESVVEEIKPDIIYTHHGGDLNIDHRITHQAVMTACRPMPGSSVKAIYAFEVPSSTEWASESERAFRPNHFVDICATMDRKIEALKAYEEEMRPFPHARSIEAVKALATWRGASVGLKAAEAFMTLRRIEG